MTKEIGFALRVELQRARGVPDISNKALVEWSLDRVSFGVVDLERELLAAIHSIRESGETQAREHAAELSHLRKRIYKLETAFRPKRISKLETASKPRRVSHTEVRVAPELRKQLQLFQPPIALLSLGWMRDDVIDHDSDAGILHVIATNTSVGYALTSEHRKRWACFVCQRHEYTLQDFEAQAAAFNLHWKPTQ